MFSYRIGALYRPAVIRKKDRSPTSTFLDLGRFSSRALPKPSPAVFSKPAETYPVGAFPPAGLFIVVISTVEENSPRMAQPEFLGVMRSADDVNISG
jgi:hypothetical protein